MTSSACDQLLDQRQTVAFAQQGDVSMSYHIGRTMTSSAIQQLVKLIPARPRCHLSLTPRGNSVHPLRRREMTRALLYLLNCQPTLLKRAPGRLLPSTRRVALPYTIKCLAAHLTVSTPVPPAPNQSTGALDDERSAGQGVPTPSPSQQERPYGGTLLDAQPRGARSRKRSIFE